MKKFKEYLFEAVKKKRKAWFTSKKKREEHGLKDISKKDIEERVKRLKRAAKRGDIESPYALGIWQAKKYGKLKKKKK